MHLRAQLTCAYDSSLTLCWLPLPLPTLLLTFPAKAQMLRTYFVISLCLSGLKSTCSGSALLSSMAGKQMLNAEADISFRPQMQGGSGGTAKELAGALMWNHKEAKQRLITSL